MAVPSTPFRIGFVPSHRGFFSSELAATARHQFIAVMRELGLEVIAPNEQQTKLGCVENRLEADVCAELFRQSNVGGIVIGAMNFGDEQAAAHVIRQARLNVPILLVGAQEQTNLGLGTQRRDAFCGLLSIGEALRQIGAPYSVGLRPICSPADDPRFRNDLDAFVSSCRVVNGIRSARYGQLGARPDAFWTCRFDERKLQQLGPCTVVMDLSEAFAAVARIPDGDPDVARILRDVAQYADTSTSPDHALIKIAKFELFLRRWTEEQGLDALAIQCWTSIQQNLGICACTAMSRLGDVGIPCACEADILGTLSMHACQLASGAPAALADWNNLHNDDDELVNLWHCGVFPKAFASGQPRLKFHEILKSVPGIGKEKSFGTIEFEAKPAPITLLRVAQDPSESWKAVIVQGAFENNRANTFGSYGWCRINGLQKLYREVLLMHFPHHVAVTQTHVGDALWEAFGNYLGFDVYGAQQGDPGRYTKRQPAGDIDHV